MMPVPRVSVRNSDKYPIKPRDGAENTIRVLPPPDDFISVICALRLVIFSITTPENSSSTSITTSSIGSNFSPFSPSCITTRGRDTLNSNPSRRMVSIKIPNCNSPRPDTSNDSLFALCVTRRAMLVSASLKRRSPIIRDVNFFPDRPANGDVFTKNVMVRVGGSIGIAGIGSVTSGAHRVSATVARENPATTTMSPADADSNDTFSIPRCSIIFVIFAFSINSPFMLMALTVWPTRTVPDSILPVKMRPTYGSASSVVANIEKGASI